MEALRGFLLRKKNGGEKPDESSSSVATEGRQKMS